MILYHRTSQSAANAILASGEFQSRENDGSVYFSTHKHGEARGYGDAILILDIPDELCEIDDEFPDGETHYRVKQQNLSKTHIVGRE